jgi:RNA-directed DNA polymerase
MRLFIKPSIASIKKARQAIKDVFKQLRGRPVFDLITKLNPIIRGIGNYWSSQVAKKIFGKIDYYIWIKVRKHLKTLHDKKSFKWIYKKYFKPDNTGVSKDKWILTDPHDDRTQLFRMSWIPIVRHTVIRYKNSPDESKLILADLQELKQEFAQLTDIKKEVTGLKKQIEKPKAKEKEKNLVESGTGNSK